MNFPSMDAGGYHKYPLRPKTILATVDSTQRLQPTVCTSNAVKPNNNQNTALAEVAVVQPAHRAIPDDQKPAPTRQIPYTISAAQLTVPDPMQTKQKAPIVGATVKPQGNFVYHQRAIILNPSSVPNSQPYYSQMTPQNYMVRPIYVRMMKPFQGNYLVNQMAVNQQSQLAQSRRATLQWWW